MNKAKFNLRQVLFRQLRLLRLLPRLVVIAARRRRRQQSLAAAEAERLDRIRNPSDYRGK